MLLSSINVNLYKLSKEDKPFLPTDGKKNANHVRQDILVSIATKIKENITNDAKSNSRQNRSDGNTGSTS